MSESAQQVIASALQLTPSERAVVATAILASLEPPSDESTPEVRDAWSNEIRKRIDDIDSGRVKTIPSAEAWKMIDGEADLPD